MTSKKEVPNAEKDSERSADLTPQFILLSSLGLIWVLGCILFQQGIWPAFVMYVVYIVALLILPHGIGRVADILKSTPFVFLATALPVSGWYVLGWYNLWRDLLLITSVVMVLGVVWILRGDRITKMIVDTLTDVRIGWRKYRRAHLTETARWLGWELGLEKVDWERQRSELNKNYDLGKWKLRTGIALVFISSWFLVTVADHFCGPNLLSRRSPLKLSHQQATDEEVDAELIKVGVALSGGGFRAALMHAGVLDALEIELPRHNANISGISSVSGGSIIGGVFAHGGSPAEFKNAVAAGQFNLKRELLYPLHLARLPTPFHVRLPKIFPVREVSLLPFGEFNRTDIFVSLLDRVLFNEIEFINRTSGDARRWLVCATDLLSGDAVGLTPHAVIRIAPTREGLVKDEGRCEPVLKAASPTRVSQLVAASGAYPGAFSTVRFRNGADKSAELMELADGGLTDNRGIALLRAADKLLAGWDLDLLIASDGGKRMNRLASDDEVGIELNRAMNVVYATSGLSYGNSNTKNTIVMRPDAVKPGCLRELLAPFRGIGLERDMTDNVDDTLLRKVAENLVRDEGFEEIRAECDAVKGDDRAVHALLAYFKACQRVFESASTLKDNYRPKEAARLFALGHFLVLAHRTRLDALANDARATR